MALFYGLGIVAPYSFAMKQTIHAPIIVIDGQSLQIKANEKLGCYVPILEQTKRQFDAMLSRHARVLFVRIDLHMPHYTETNILMSNFIRRLRRRITDRYKVKSWAFLWVREHSKQKHQHYHLWFMLDAKAVRHPKRIIHLIEEMAERQAWPKPYTPKNCYKVIHRNDATAYSEAFERASYLAKVNTKGYRPPSTNDYGASRIKPLIGGV